MTTVTTIGIDLAKNSFSVYGVNAKGKPILNRTLTRAGVVRFFANLPYCLADMELALQMGPLLRENTKDFLLRFNLLL